MHKTVALLPGEYWWGGLSRAGAQMPFGEGVKLDLRGDNHANQAAPLLVSSAGRFIWSDEPFAFAFTKSKIELEGAGPFVVEQAGANLKQAYLAAERRFFPPQGKNVDPLLFTRPQFNSWIELLYEQAQEPLLAYARQIVKRGYEPGVLMIDEGWFNYYGDWRFDTRRFPDAKKMIRELHEMGFKVMLWVIHFVVPDSAVFRQLRGTNVLVKGPDGKPVIREWWNGYSATVDVTGGEGLAWFQKQLDFLRREYGVDGFKFDGGDTPFYRDDDRLAVPTSASGHTEAWARLGLRYKLNEYRACWKNGGAPLMQRLADKHHSWAADGMASLIPSTLAQGLMGHPFVCADMIGGGEYQSFLAESNRLDQELFVRYAQAAALMPMMQFSAAPWRVLDARHQKLCREAAALHVRFGKTIAALARESARTGEPIARHLAYEFPGQGYETVGDQFLLGPDILVAPVVEKGVRKRTVQIPTGRWQADDGSVITGPSQIEVATPLERLPFFQKKKGRN